MVTQELLKYITTLKQQGQSNEIIKEILINTNWPIEDINQALLQADTQLTSQPSIVNKSIMSSIEEKPKIIKTISTLIFLIGILYTESTISILGVIIIMDKVMSNVDLTFSLLKNFPTLGIVPILFSFVGLFFFYISLKVSNGSKFGFWLGLKSLIVVPILVTFFSQMFMSSFLEMVANNSGNNPVPTLLSAKPSTFELKNPVFILAVICVIALITSFKKFQFINETLSRKAKMFLTIVFVILVIPTISIVIFNFIKVQETDFGLTTAEATVGHHIYKPSVVPNGLTYASKFVLGKELAGKQSAVQVAFDIPLDTFGKGEESRVIVVKQVSVDQKFNLDSFSATYMENADIQEISIRNAIDGKGYLFQKDLGDSTLYSILYLTKDNILINLISPKAKLEELVALAESLE